MAVPRCAALRRDGRPCGALASSPTATFCRHHERLVEKHGKTAVKEGRYPRTRKPRSGEPVILETMPTNGSSSHTVSPAGVRPALAEAAAASLGEIQQALLDAALGATREHWATFTCPDCGKKHRVQVAVPDVRARVAAIELLLREGLGRPAQAEEPLVSRLPDSVEALRDMPWADLQVLIAMTYVDEIAAVSERGPEALREKVAGMSEDERALLREALAA
jgi:hypothetical protein